MYTDFMTGHVLFDEDLGSLDDSAAHHEERRLELLLIEVLEQSPRCMLERVEIQGTLNVLG